MSDRVVTYENLASFTPRGFPLIGLSSFYCAECQESFEIAAETTRELEDTVCAHLANQHGTM